MACFVEITCCLICQQCFRNNCFGPVLIKLNETSSLLICNKYLMAVEVDQAWIDNHNLIIRTYLTELQFWLLAVLYVRSSLASYSIFQLKISLFTRLKQKVLKVSASKFLSLLLVINSCKLAKIKLAKSKKNRDKRQGLQHTRFDFLAFSSTTVKGQSHKFLVEIVTHLILYL